MTSASRGSWKRGSHGQGGLMDREATNIICGQGSPPCRRQGATTKDTPPRRGRDGSTEMRPSVSSENHPSGDSRPFIYILVLPVRFAIGAENAGLAKIAFK